MFDHNYMMLESVKTDSSISNLNHNDFLMAIDWVLQDMRTQFLRVVLIPSRIPEIAAHGGKIRLVESENPRWYRDLCAEYEVKRSRPRNRKSHDTLIRRAHVIRALKAIKSGENSGIYIERLYPYIWDMAEGKYNDEF